LYKFICPIINKNPQPDPQPNPQPDPQPNPLNLIAKSSNINTSKIFFNLNTEKDLDGSSIKILIFGFKDKFIKINYNILNNFIPNANLILINNNNIDLKSIIEYLDMIINISISMNQSQYVPFIYFPYELTQNDIFIELEYILKTEFFIMPIYDNDMIISITKLITYTLILDAIVKKYKIKHKLGFYILTNKILKDNNYYNPKKHNLKFDNIIHDIIMNDLMFWK